MSITELPEPPGGQHLYIVRLHNHPLPPDKFPWANPRRSEQVAQCLHAGPPQARYTDAANAWHHGKSRGAGAREDPKKLVVQHRFASFYCYNIKLFM